MFSNEDEPAKYSRGGEFLENIMNNNILEFCRRWFGLGGIREVIDDIKEFFTYNRYTGKSLDTLSTDAIYFVKNNEYNPIIFMDENSYKFNNSVYFENSLDSNIKKDLIEKIKKGALL